VTDTLKVLDQLAAAATTAETLYTVPATAQTTTSSLVVCNTSGSAATFRVAIRKAGETLTTKQYIYYDQALAANSTFASILGMTLGPTDVVTVYASATGLSFNLFGVETS